MIGQKINGLTNQILIGVSNFHSTEFHLFFLIEAGHVQKSLMPEVQLATNGITLEAVIYIFGAQENLTWDWNWREAEQALEYGLKKSFPEVGYFVAVYSKVNIKIVFFFLAK